MARLMSVAWTEDQVRRRIKRVTRRKGWWLDRHGRRLLRPGDPLTLCRKVMGRKPGEPLVTVATVRVVDVRRELLADISEAEVALEGFPGWTPRQFLDFFCDRSGLTPMAKVTRIEWVFLDEADQARLEEFVARGRAAQAAVDRVLAEVLPGLPARHLLAGDSPELAEGARSAEPPGVRWDPPPDNVLGPQSRKTRGRNKPEEVRVPRQTLIRQLC